MTEHERIILQAAANILRDNGMRLQTEPWTGASYPGRQFSHAAAEIDYALRCYDDATTPAPQSLRVQP